MRANVASSPCKRESPPPPPQALQFLDVITMKDPSQKAQFFRTTLTDVFPFIPRASMDRTKMYLFSCFTEHARNITVVHKDVPIC